MEIGEDSRKSPEFSKAAEIAARYFRDGDSVGCIAIVEEVRRDTEPDMDVFLAIMKELFASS